jgi:hypothetical protein
MAIDLDDVSGCPVARRCESCGQAAEVDVVTLDTVVGVYCLTVCGTCVAAAEFPTDLHTTAMLVGRHCQHLGIDLDAMADARDTDR